MDTIICPNCGKVITCTDRHYFYCVEFMGVGCNTIWARDPECYFTQLYIVNKIGEIIGYKQAGFEGGKIIKTNRVLPKYPLRKIKV